MQQVVLLFALMGQPVVYENSAPPHRLNPQRISFAAAEERLLNGEVEMVFFALPGRFSPNVGVTIGPVICADNDEALAVLKQWKEGGKTLPNDTTCHRRHPKRDLFNYYRYRGK